MSNWIKIDESFVNADHIAIIAPNSDSFEMESVVVLDFGKTFVAEDPPEKLIEKILEGENK